ncbi:MAG: ethylbenzene dehydrogenase-related protein [Verrucomicrobia subdivision 3 bacterium]|nr:ethylbenzene dehydrogenase-related protein [Limisphaerales bacterium]
MNSHRILVSTAILAMAGLLAQSRAAEVPKLVVAKITQAPAVDGKGDEATWRSAKPVEVVAKGVMPKTRGTSSTVTLRAAHTDTHIYLLVQWTDATKNDAGHKTWVWDTTKNAYAEDTDREDALSIAFEHTGAFTANMLSGDEAVWDVWHWKAFRTNPQGFAMDRLHHYFKSQPTVKANKHTAKDGGDVWIARPEDSGDTVEKKQAAPTENKGARMPQYLHGIPTGSAADVQAKGAWADGKWTLEFARKLNTGHADDTAFDPSRSYKLAVSVHNDTGDMDKASGVIELSFAK